MTKKQIMDLILLALSAAIMIVKAVVDSENPPELNSTDEDMRR